MANKDLEKGDCCVSTPVRTNNHKSISDNSC